jgi:hypothetical protein
MDSAIADKLRQRQEDVSKANKGAKKALGLGFFEFDAGQCRYTYEDKKTQASLATVFGRAAYARAVRLVEMRDASHALASVLLKPEVNAGNLAVVCNGKFRFSLKKMFPNLKAGERAEVKAGLEGNGFVFAGDQITDFKHRLQAASIIRALK